MVDRKKRLIFDGVGRILGYSITACRQFLIHNNLPPCRCLLKEADCSCFKLDLPESEKVAGLVTALYNSRGGKIILGVDDDWNPLGLKDPQRVEHKFTQVIRHWCKLDEDPEIEFVGYKGKDFIVIHCPRGKDTPYFVRGGHVPKVRVGSSNMACEQGGDCTALQGGVFKKPGYLSG